MKTWQRAGMVFITLLVIFSMVSLVSAQEADPAEEAQRLALYEASNALTTGDFDALIVHLAADYVVHTPLGDLDTEGLIGFFTGLRASLSDFNMEREQVIVEGDWAATRFTISGTFDGADFPTPMGVLPPNGQPIVVTVVNLFHFNEDGLVAEEWAQFDVLGFLTQLGAFPST